MADESPDFDLQDAYRVYKADTQSFVQGLLDRNGICKGNIYIPDLGGSLD